MSYSEELRAFAATHTYKDIKVDGSTFHYVLSGKKGGKTLILLNGGMNTLEMWMRYIDALSDTYQVLSPGDSDQPGTGKRDACFFRKAGD